MDANLEGFIDDNVEEEEGSGDDSDAGSDSKRKHEDSDFDEDLDEDDLDLVAENPGIRLQKKVWNIDIYILYMCLLSGRVFIGKERALFMSYFTCRPIYLQAWK